MFSRLAQAACFLALATLPLRATEPWAAMDYGPFVSATFNNAEGKSTYAQHGCAANKGIAIRLGENGEGTMLFDTELLRMAGGWTGGFFKKIGVVFDGKHGPNPQPPDEAQMIFQTEPTGPGWS